jgi:hypothetical protein
LRKFESVAHELWVNTTAKHAGVPFIAEAKIGAWREKFAPVSITLVESTWGHLMPPSDAS